MAVANRWRIFIESLDLNEEVFKGEEDVKGAIVGFNEHLFREDVEWRPKLGG